MATIDLRLVGPVIGELPASLIPHFFDTLARKRRIGIHLRGAGRTTTTCRGRVQVVRAGAARRVSRDDERPALGAQHQGRAVSGR